VVIAQWEKRNGIEKFMCKGGLDSLFGTCDPPQRLGISDCLPGIYHVLICTSLKNRTRHLLSLGLEF